MEKKYLYLYTIGCQMNVYDSEQIEKILIPENYEKTDDLKQADLIIVNTCSIRKKAEEKAFSFLGTLPGLKKINPELIIGVAGCVAQQEGENILKRASYVDLVFGTHATSKLPELLRDIKNEGNRIVDVEMKDEIMEFDIQEDMDYQSGISNYVTIMRGCENFCTYCIVPYVRGKEISRKPETIVKEIEGLVKNGLKEVTLLGQNVNSYGKKEGLCSFAELLGMVNNVKGLERIRFATSHPKDLSDDLIYAMKDLNKVCTHIHLPVQSGSNKILKGMNRKYSREKYIERVEKLRSVCPDISLSSDMIVGFPGETEEDFQETLDLVKTIEFDSLFAFIYSDRPKAPAAKFSEKIDLDIKKRRLQELLDLQKELSRGRNNELVGKMEEVMVEGYSKIKPENQGKNGILSEIQWTGRTPGNKIVNFVPPAESSCSDSLKVGNIVNVRIEKALPNSILGVMVSDHTVN